MEQQQSINVFLWGTDPLTRLTNLDGLLRALHRLPRGQIRIICIADKPRHSANILTLMFHDLIILESSGNDRISEILRRTDQYKGLKVLIPVMPDEARLIAQFRDTLKSAGILTAGVNRAGLEKLRSLNNTQQEPSDIPRVNWTQIKTIADIGPVAMSLFYPVEMTSEDRKNRWIISDHISLDVLARSQIVETGQSLLARNWGNETAYQAGAVLDANSQFFGYAAVREITENPQSEPWIFLGIENDDMMELCKRASIELDLHGPLTFRILCSPYTREYQLDWIQPVLPIWTDLAADCNVNLIWILLKSICGMPIQSSNTIMTAGKMITFSSFDIPVPSEHWLRIAGKGGYCHE